MLATAQFKANSSQLPHSALNRSSHRKHRQCVGHGGRQRQRQRQESETRCVRAKVGLEGRNATYSKNANGVDGKLVDVARHDCGKRRWYL